MSLIGVKDWHKKVDGHRPKGSEPTWDLLDRITTRRNKIVHTGDRSGRSRARITIDEVQDDLDGLESIVHALERVLA